MKWVFVFVVLLAVEFPFSASEVPRFSYIVHVDKSKKPEQFGLHRDWYVSMLNETNQSILYTYDVVMHGFAAKLTSREAKSMEKMNGCLGVYRDSLNQLHTTRTPDFLKLTVNDGPWEKSSFGDNIIVGMLDSGVWPESKSFSGRGLSQVPAKWKGKCESGDGFNSTHCNRKLIGARFFLSGYEAVVGLIPVDQDYRSPRDADGHGTHTASTAAGSAVQGVNLLGFAQGTARGMAVKARLAIYKVCWPQGCADSDILAGMETAISDGVDVLSLSIGGANGRPYYSDPIAIGALEATLKGVFVACSAGNSGPTPSDISNTAPWIATVGASTIDRAFPGPVALGNGKTYVGSSLYKGSPAGNKQLPLVYASMASNNSAANLCLPGSLDSTMVRRKIVLCDRGVNGRAEKGLVVQQAGGAAMILANELSSGDELTTDCHLLPATIVGFRSGKHIKDYINSTRNPTATIRLDGSTVVRKVRAPMVAGFSSRGPNPVVPELLKPDLIAPGVDILAAWSRRNAPTTLKSDNRRVDYNIISGTSMSCPHVSGIAALVRSVHPTWSPAAIKSALITSSLQVDNIGKSIRDSVTKRIASPFVLGAGHVNPSGALDPGLIYDLGINDYVRFLCSLSYSNQQIRILTKMNYSCPKLPSQPGDLNYPSFSVIFRPRSSVHVTRRIVTNVGQSPCVYALSVQSPPSVNISVQPEVVIFQKANQKASFSVRFESKIASSVKNAGRQEFGQLTWKCMKGGSYVVRSPIAIVWNLN
ncbi:hypothetical protein SUGI_0195410 [Cryptomeria japonica]|nr:hypothetical protein SUGI_0195410 [Cryptomeria japonica]